MEVEERWHDGKISWTDTKKSSVLGCLSRVANAAAPILETGGGDHGFVCGLGPKLDDLELEDNLRFEDNFGPKIRKILGLEMIWDLDLKMI